MVQTDLAYEFCAGFAAANAGLLEQIPLQYQAHARRNLGATAVPFGLLDSMRLGFHLRFDKRAVASIQTLIPTPAMFPPEVRWRFLLCSLARASKHTEC